jgi:A/G-specific adenine glycosylase
MDVVDSKAKYIRSRLLRWSISYGRSFPWRETDDPYKICIAEILLQQTFARKVVPVYGRLIELYPTVADLSKAPVKKIEKLIYPLGLVYRAGVLKKLANQLVTKYCGMLPNSEQELLGLFGVGQYVSSAILCFAFNKSVTIIDTNVVRIYVRYFGMDIRLPSSLPNNEIQLIASSVLAKRKARQFNYALLDFAALVCSHYNPKCHSCPISFHCHFYPT